MPRYVALTMLLFLCVTAAAQTAPLSLQGKLTGVPDGEQDLTLLIWDVAQGGTPIASVPFRTQVDRGLFSAVIETPTTAFNGDERWWSVLASAGETARQRVASVPHALATRGITVDADGQLRVDASLTVVAGPDEPGLLIRHNNPDVGPLVFAPSQFEPLTGAGRFSLFAPFAHPAGASSGPSASLFYWSGTSLAIGAPEIDPSRPEFSVGIGTSEPTARLDVRGAAKVVSLTITGGSDLAEPFPTSSSACGLEVQPGMVMAISRDRDGELVPASSAYDTAVAGVISGANGLSPGMVMKSEGTPLADGDHPLAMAGRVWVLADASFGPIARGDRLTTSNTPGHAMKVTDETRAPGAVIGKAMTELPEGRGYVLVLVNLQ